MSKTIARGVHHRPRICAAISGVLGLAFGTEIALAADPMPNACPVDGCEVKVVDVKQAGDELELTLEANFSPDLSKNHIHIWWGEQYSVKQVSRNAEPAHGVKQGKWHLTDDYPNYVTQGAVSTKTRGAAKTICVSTSDREHNIIDVNAFHCVDVGKLL